MEAEIVQRIPTLANTIVALGFPHALYGEEIGLVVQTESFDDIRLAIREVVRSLPLRMRPKVVLYGNDVIRRTHTRKIQRRALVPFFKPYEADGSGLTIAAVAGEVATAARP